MLGPEQECQLRVGALRMKADEFAPLLERHLDRVPRTSDVEHLGTEVVAKDFEEAEDIAAFVRQVCHWGGYSGIAARVIGRNSLQEITAAMRHGYGLALAGSAGRGVEAISRLSDLGFSFASKHLRFLIPDGAVVLDGVISNKVGYSMSEAGYEAFLADCRDVRDYLNRSGVPSHPLSSPWRVAEVEMAVYAKLMGF